MTTTPNSPGVSRPPFTRLGWNWQHLAALAGFLATYFLVERDASFAPLSVLVLLVCVLARLDEEKRRVAAIPLSLAALMLAGRVGVYAASAPSRWRGEIEQPGTGWRHSFLPPASSSPPSSPTTLAGS